MKNKILSIMLCLILTAAVLTGCGRDSQSAADETARVQAGNNEYTGNDEKRVFIYGTTAYGPEMGNAGLNPHENYSGWSTVRYGVGETLFKFTDTMELEPWLAVGYEQLDDYTVKIELRDNVYFSSGRKLDAQAVKECFEHLIEVNDRAPGDLKISGIEADDMSVTIVSSEKVPALLNYLSDPYGAVIDMEYGITEDRNVSGTGPFIAVEVDDNQIKLVKNENYWGGEVKTDEVIVKAITDGDTLTMALQSGEIDASQGLPYASLSLFKDNEDYNISTSDTSRTFFATMNYETESLQDINVRKAIAMGIDKESFTDILLQGNGTKAEGPFPKSFTFGDNEVSTLQYNPKEAVRLLEKAGYTDTDGDGYADKEGKRLTLRWLTYPGRQELPILAEAAQAGLKEIGVELIVNSTANHGDFIENGEWDIYASAFVTAPTGDPAYFFTTHALETSAKNRGKYFNERLETLAEELSEEFDAQKRSDIAVEMEQIILDDQAFIFASHLKMSFVMKSYVTGFEAHPSDYYELSSGLDINK